MLKVHITYGMASQVVGLRPNVAPFGSLKVKRKQIAAIGQAGKFTYYLI